MLDVLSSEEDVPRSFLGKIFQSLSKAGLVKSARGAGGGFSLAVPAEKISALAVIEAVEGPLALTRCLDEDLGCEHAGGCALCGLFSSAQERVREVLAQGNIAELAGRHIPGGAVRNARERSPIVFRPVGSRTPAANVTQVTF
jgi:Rrf2 family protein